MASIYFQLFFCTLLTIGKITGALQWKEEYNGYQYFMTQSDLSQKNWFDARADCMAEGGDLVTIETKDEEDFIRTIYSTFFRNLWIGLNRLRNEDVWEWADGGTSSVKSWASGEPRADEYCTLRLSKSNRLWYSENCGKSLGYICKRKIGVVTPKTTIGTPVPGYCPAGWVDPKTDRCFKVFTPTEPVTWAEALRKCKDLPYIGGSLACANTQSEVSILNIMGARQAGEKKFWIGLRRIYTSSGWQWVDNTPMRITNFYNDYLPSLTGCGYTSSTLNPAGSWGVERICTGTTNLKSYICQIRKDPNNIIPTPAPTSPSTCGMGYRPFGKGCYKLLKEGATFTDAREACFQDGANMADIHDAGENAAIQILLDENKVHKAWIGLEYDTGIMEYKWTSGWFFNFASWGVDQPKFTDDGGCVAMQREDRFWYDTVCYEKLPVVCKTTTAYPVTEPPDMEGRCPGREWFSIGGHCFWVCSVCDSDWLNQQIECQKLYPKATLSAIHDHATNVKLHKALLDYNNLGDAWLGLFLSPATKRWMWSDGSTVDYTNWAPKQPPAIIDNNQCVFMPLKGTNAGMWVTGPCTIRRGRLCQVEKSPLITSPMPVLGDCPSSAWKKHGADCYLFRPDESFTRAKAKEQCKKEGGPRAHLVRLDNFEKNDYVHYYMYTQSHLPSNGRNYWTGLSKMEDGETYRWDDNKVALNDNFTHWGAYQPVADSSTFKGHCVEVNFRTSLWHNNVCNKYRGFACQYSIPTSGGRKFQSATALFWASILAAFNVLYLI